MWQDIKDEFWAHPLSYITAFLLGWNLRAILAWL